MAFLYNHLEQINLSAQSIGELEFGRPKPFTNALLHNREITALIRDTEPYERGLFSVDPSIRHNNGQARISKYGLDTGPGKSAGQGPGRTSTSAVARVLGNDMLRRIQTSSRDSSKGRGVDIEVLLEGAEKLCTVFDVPGTQERISTLRSNHQQITRSIQFYEGKISKQQSSLSRLGNKEDGARFDAHGRRGTKSYAETGQKVTDEDIEAEEEAIKELEDRKQALESRMLGMERDLGRLRE